MRKRSRIRLLVAAKLLSLCLVGTASADQWTFFHPEMVKTYGCKVAVLDMQINGSSERHDVWEAAATAMWTDGTQWQYTLAVFPLTLKGKHQAEKACFKWMDEAEKRVKAAH